MKILQSRWLSLPLTLVFLLSACATSNSRSSSGKYASPPAEIVRPTYLREILRYLYRWQLEEAEVELALAENRLIFWVCRSDIPLDPGDRSITAEIMMPQLGISVRVKKADYTIEETRLVIKNPNFQIQKVTRGNMPGSVPKECQVVDLDTKEVREYLFRTRNEHDYPNASLLEHLRQAVRQEATKIGLEIPAVGEQIVHVGPLSPVASEIWVYWENGHKLIYYSSDIDLTNPALWEYEPLMVHIYDLDSQVVVSQQEAEGSNRYLTRYQVSRTLFNCLVFGERITLTPPAVAGSASQP